VARDDIRDMPPAGAEIEGQFRAQLLRERSDRIEILP
jgi:hypothetical protein